MAELPPNLDDGEVWLPSHIFTPHHRSCMDDFTERFAAFTLLQPRRNVPKPSLNPYPNLERLGPAVLCGPACPQEYGGLEVEESGHGLLGSYFSGHKLMNLEPVQPQEVVNSFRARVLRAQQNRLQNRLLQFQGSGGFGVGGGFVQESGGTGVFIPRTTLNTTITSGTTADTRNKQVSRKRQEMQVTQQGSNLKGNGVGKQGESHRYLPPEMVLPQDWTY